MRGGLDLVLFTWRDGKLMNLGQSLDVNRNADTLGGGVKK